MSVSFLSKKEKVAFRFLTNVDGSVGLLILRSSSASLTETSLSLFPILNVSNLRFFLIRRFNPAEKSSILIVDSGSGMSFRLILKLETKRSPNDFGIRISSWITDVWSIVSCSQSNGKEN